MHLGDPRWDHPPPLSGNAIDLYGVARPQGFLVSGQPAPRMGLTIYERVLGPDHPDTVATRRALEEMAAETNGSAAGG
jgi:hypothetical protein